MICAFDNSILELLILKKWIGIDKFGIEVCYKKFYPQINLP